jgi:BlaI family transcriptional regulator, penicillinase repressor
VSTSVRLQSLKRDNFKNYLRLGTRGVTDRRVTQRDTGGRPLTELQQAILNIIWSTGPATAEQVREALQPTHPLKDSSVRTLLRRLEARGYLGHEVAGNTFVYRAAIPASSVAARAVRHIIDRFCSGSVEQFLVGMVDEHVISRREIERLARKVKKQK